MILFFYNLALLVALALSAPLWLFKMATAEKYRDLSKRFGRLPQHLLSNSAAQPVLWLHAVSVGEVLAITRLVRELDAALPTHRILVSTTTRTGQALARQRFGADRVFYCPLDLPWAVRRVMKALQPKMLILAETEFWPNLLAACFRRHIPVAVVNARISDRSYPRYLRLRSLWRPFLSRLSAVLAQSPLDADRLKAIGCANVSIAGNLKFDVRAPQESEATRTLRTIGSGLRFLVAGSTLDGEEAALIAAWPALVAGSPGLAMVLAPRHPDRFAAVAALLNASGLPWQLRSSWNTTPPAPLRPGQILLLDSIGELASVYSLAAVAFVGGSLVEAGGHNPLEPAQFAVPTVMGPHYVNFRAITEDLLTHDALRIAQPDQLAATLLALLRDPAQAQAIGARARHVFEQQAGATARCVSAVRALLPAAAPHPSPEPVVLGRRA
ncbi:3-deoxy-D-manno-octulosonic acid transferase [Acidobacteria bacterium AB60]|nr:3-deoxy-D-manno-octulosonic acid transferase [Acidobacteria bacterium AB60]